MKLLIFGAGGQLGSELMRQGREQNLDIHGVDYPQTDITVMSQVSDVFFHFQPLLVINAAAYTNVDGAEEHQDIAYAVNRDGAGHVAQAAAAAGADFYQISTDFIFDGTKGEDYLEDDQPNPQSVYAASKLEGELAVRDKHPAPVIIRSPPCKKLRNELFSSGWSGLNSCSSTRIEVCGASVARVSSLKAITTKDLIPV